MEYTENRRVIFAMFTPEKKNPFKENIKAMASAGKTKGRARNHSDG